MNKNRIQICATLVLATAAGLPQISQASEYIEEIVVTSRKTDESLQDVPLSVSAFTAQDIERMAPRSLRDIDGYAPNVHISRQTAGPGMGAIFIRGLGYQDVEKETPPPVGVIIDGVVMGTNTGQLIDMFDVEQVEVNRGPQGVLFGKNTTGGTIEVKRVKPHFDGFGGALAAQFGDYGEQIYKGRLNLELADDVFALKVGGISKQHDGYYDNPILGDIGAVDYQSYTISGLWHATDNLTVQLTYDQLDDTSDSVAMDARYDGDNPWLNTNDWDAQTEYDQDITGLQINWDVGFGTITAISGWVDSADYVEQDFDSATLASFDSSVTPPVAPEPLAQLHTIRDQTYDQFTQEIRLSGLIGEDINYTVGYYYWDAEITLEQRTNAVAQLANPTPLSCFQFGAVDGTGIVPGFLFAHPVLGDSFCQTPYAPDPTGAFGPFIAGLATQTMSEDIKSKAWFGNITWQATDKLELGFGARYIDEEKDFNNNFVSAPGGAPAPAGFPIVGVSDDWDDTIIKTTASYAFHEEAMVYGSYAQGFRSGGFSTRANNINQLTYEPENVDNLEIGFKGTFFGGRLQTNLAAYRIELEDPQFSVVIQDPFQAPGTNTVLLNGGQVEIQGIEIDIHAALTDNFRVLATIGTQDGESESFTADSSFLPIGPVGTAGTAGVPTVVPSNDLSRTPDWNYSLTGIYDRMIRNLRFTASVSVRDSDEYNIITGLLGQGNLSTDPGARFDARVSLEWVLKNSDVVTASVIGKNLTEEEYLDFLLPLGATGGFQGWAPPRTVALELKWVR